ncbi:1532_t:CDS:2 [Diversispora eburnea]|uniref:1532_t:CDS:1 n=1 Tax=Diversispora eburnea TaxID=1213867 RepID=A0A9N9CSW6_9GLOM|nr:1532_t:CDS:2 [Diversispora eburnea]
MELCYADSGQPQTTNIIPTKSEKIEVPLTNLAASQEISVPAKKESSPFQNLTTNMPPQSSLTLSNGDADRNRERRGGTSRHRHSISRSKTRSRSPRRSRTSRKHRRRSLSRSSSSRSRSREYKSLEALSEVAIEVEEGGELVEPDPSHVLGVFNLSLRTTEKDLQAIFERYGRVNQVTIVYDHRSDRSRGFGFVYMNSVEEASIAKDKTNGMEVNGRNMRVDYSLTQRPHTPTPGEYMGDRPSRYRVEVGQEDEEDPAALVIRVKEGRIAEDLILNIIAMFPLSLEPQGTHGMRKSRTSKKKRTCIRREKLQVH